MVTARTDHVDHLHLLTTVIQAALIVIKDKQGRLPLVLRGRPGLPRPESI